MLGVQTCCFFTEGKPESLNWETLKKIMVCQDKKKKACSHEKNTYELFLKKDHEVNILVCGSRLKRHSKK